MDLEIAPVAPAGDAVLRLDTGSGTTSIPFRLDSPLQPGNKAVAQGIDQDDVIYLIMLDRFSDGDPANNRPIGTPKDAVGRDKPRGFHGGDLQGIINHLPYFQELGVTALWITPWYKNFAGIYDCDQTWCPYTYYHGYHAVDHYAVDEHFGSLSLLRELVVKAHARGLKVIQDQVSNHVGLRHAWVQDPPLPTWFHGTPSRHVQNPFKSEFLLSPHAAQSRACLGSRRMVQSRLAGPEPGRTRGRPLLDSERPLVARHDRA